MPGDPVRELVDRLSAASILVSADVTKDDIAGVDTETLSGRILEEYSSREGLKIVGKGDIERILNTLRSEKAPAPMERLQKTGFAAYAAEIDADYSINTSNDEDIPVIASFDLAQAIARPTDKALLWQDLLLARSVLQNV